MGAQNIPAVYEHGISMYRIPPESARRSRRRHESGGEGAAVSIAWFSGEKAGFSETKTPANSLVFKG